MWNHTEKNKTRNIPTGIEFSCRRCWIIYNINNISCRKSNFFVFYCRVDPSSLTDLTCQKTCGRWYGLSQPRRFSQTRHLFIYNLSLVQAIFFLIRSQHGILHLLPWALVFFTSCHEAYINSSSTHLQYSFISPSAVAVSPDSALYLRMRLDCKSMQQDVQNDLYAIKVNVYTIVHGDGEMRLLAT